MFLTPRRPLLLLLLLGASLSVPSAPGDVLVSASLTDVVTRGPGGTLKRSLITADTALLLNGKEVRPENLNPGMEVTVVESSPGVATRVEAKGKGKLLNSDETQPIRVNKLPRQVANPRERRTPIGDTPRGRVISAGITGLVVTGMPGKPPISYAVDRKTTVTLAGSAAVLEDIRPGMEVDVTARPGSNDRVADSIQATIPAKVERK